MSDQPVAWFEHPQSKTLERYDGPLGSHLVCVVNPPMNATSDVLYSREATRRWKSEDMSKFRSVTLDLFFVEGTNIFATDIADAERVYELVQARGET